LEINPKKLVDPHLQKHFGSATMSTILTAGIPDCPASGQSGNGLKLTNDAGSCPVPDYSDAVRHFFGPVPD
jgi:hypothetical protein